MKLTINSISTSAVTLTLCLNIFMPLAGNAYGENFKSYRDIILSPEIQNLNSDNPAEGVMRADADEIATLLHVHSYAGVVRNFKATSTSPPPRAVQQARLLCLYKLMIASEEVRKAVALIDHEVSIANASVNALVAKRNMTSNLLNTVNFAQGGTLGTIKQSLGFPGGAGMPPRQEIAMVSFGTSIALSLVNLLQANAWHEKIETPPNCLAQIFDDKRHPDDASQSYLWKFLNSPIPGATSSMTRREILVKHFEAISGIDPADEITKKRIAAIPGNEKELNESIRILNRRIDLLHDLKTHVEEFDGSLFEFHRAIALN